MRAFSCNGARGERGQGDLSKVMRSAGWVEEQLIRASLALGTLTTYSQAWQMWEDWFGSMGLGDRDHEMALLLYGGH